MKKFITFIFVLLFAANIFAASIVRIANATDDYTLYFCVVAQSSTSSNCYPVLQTQNLGNGAGYCTLEPLASRIFSNFTELNFWYPLLKVICRGDAVSPIQLFSPSAADTFYLDDTILSMDWSYVIAKA